MVKITYVEANGTVHVQDVPIGSSVMQGAVKNGVPGILAECGGACACGTCRVFVDQAWRERTGEPSDMENATLDVHPDNVPGQRLSCQMQVEEDWDGLVVCIPERQF